MASRQEIDHGAARGKIGRAALVLTTAAILFLPPFAPLRSLSAQYEQQTAQAQSSASPTHLGLWRQADRILMTAPSLLMAGTTGEQDRLRVALQSDLARLDAELRQLRLQGAASEKGAEGGTVDAIGSDNFDHVAAMEQLTGQLSESLKVLDRAAGARLAIHYLKAEQREAANEARRRIAAVLKPWASKTAATVAALRGDLIDSSLDDAGRLEVSSDLIDALMLQRRVERALASSARAELALAVAACCTSQSRLSDIEPIIAAAVTDLEDLDAVMAQAGLPSLARPLGVLRRVGLGPQSIVKLRQAELRMLMAAETTLARNTDLAEAVSGQFSDLEMGTQEAKKVAN